jgi:MFS superfamily sulfate permease-like transporter
LGRTQRLHRRRANFGAKHGVQGCRVVNGIPTQTAMADRAGAHSQVTQLVFAGAVLLVLLLPYATADADRW